MVQKYYVYYTVTVLTLHGSRGKCRPWPQAGPSTLGARVVRSGQVPASPGEADRGFGGRISIDNSDDNDQVVQDRADVVGDVDSASQRQKQSLQGSAACRERCGNRWRSRCVAVNINSALAGVRL